MDHLFERGAEFPYSGSYNGYYALARSGVEEPMSTHADHYHTNFAYGRAAYSKGAVYLGQLDYIIGHETFRGAIKELHNQWKMKHPTDLDVIRLMERESGMVLDWYHEYFVNTTKTIDYSITTIEGTPESTNISLERIGLMPMPLDIHVVYADGSEEMFYIPLRIMRGEKPAESDMKRTILDDWKWVNPTYSFDIPVSVDQITSIVIDPSQRLADIDKSNNVYPVEDLPEQE